MRNNYRVRMRSLARLLVGLVVSSWLAGSAEERFVATAEAISPETPEFEMVTLTGEALGKTSLKSRRCILNNLTLLRCNPGGHGDRPQSDALLWK